MVGAIAFNDSAVTLDEVTPIAELTTEPLVIVVPADSDISTLDDLVAELKADVGAVSWAGGSAGGAEQILAGLIAQDLDQDPAEVNYIAHDGGGEAIATLLSGSATTGLSGVSEFLPQIKSGDLRALDRHEPRGLSTLVAGLAARHGVRLPDRRAAGRRSRDADVPVATPPSASSASTPRSSATAHRGCRRPRGGQQRGRGGRAGAAADDRTADVGDRRGDPRPRSSPTGCSRGRCCSANRVRWSGR